MNKLTKIFASRPIAKGGTSPRLGEEHIPALRRDRLISVWTCDPVTGSLICTWRRPSEENGSTKPDAGEPL